jgi:hypothetical protein
MEGYDMTALNKISETAIKLPFSFGANGAVKTTTEQTKIWGDRVRGAIGTVVGERVMHSDFGTSIPLSEWDTTSVMEETIMEEVSSIFNIAFPTLTWTNITTEVDPYTNIVSAEIEYTLPNQDGVSTEVGIATISKNTLLTEATR